MVNVGKYTIHGSGYLGFHVCIQLCHRLEGRIEASDTEPAGLPAHEFGARCQGIPGICESERDYEVWYPDSNQKPGGKQPIYH